MYEWIESSKTHQHTEIDRLSNLHTHNHIQHSIIFEPMPKRFKNMEFCFVLWKFLVPLQKNSSLFLRATLVLPLPWLKVSAYRFYFCFPFSHGCICIFYSEAIEPLRYISSFWKWIVESFFTQRMDSIKKRWLNEYFGQRLRSFFIVQFTCWSCIRNYNFSTENTVHELTKWNEKRKKNGNSNWIERKKWIIFHVKFCECFVCLIYVWCMNSASEHNANTIHEISRMI